VIASFDQLPGPTVQHELSIALGGNGTGSVVGSGLSCSQACSQNFDEGTVVELSAQPAGGSSFAGWTGACSGSGLECEVTMSATQSVTATFNLQPQVLPPDPGQPPITDPQIEPPTLSQCKLRKARARVFIYGPDSIRNPNSVRLVIRYRSKAKAKVVVGYTLNGSKGKLNLGSAVGHFKKRGLYRRVKHLTSSQMAKVRAGGVHLLVKMRIPGEPALCARAYTRHLTVKRTIRKQTIFFQTDSDRIGRQKHHQK
jgi:hypothetical protein